MRSTHITQCLVGMITLWWPRSNGSIIVWENTNPVSFLLIYHYPCAEGLDSLELLHCYNFTYNVGIFKYYLLSSLTFLKNWTREWRLSWTVEQWAVTAVCKMVNNSNCFLVICNLSAALENTALVQGIRCEPLGEHLIPWKCAVFFHNARKWTLFVFSHTAVQIFQPTDQRSVQSTDMTECHLLYSLYVYM